MPRQSVALSWGLVSYLEWGDADAPVVLLLHGAGFDHADMSWRLLGAKLAAAGYRVLAPDHPGYGQSARAPWPFSIENGLRYLDAFVDALALDRYVLGGLSLGGGLALGHALERPDGVRGLVLFDPYGIMPRVGGRALHLMSWALVASHLLDRLALPWVKNPRLLAQSMDALVRNPEQRTAELASEVLASAKPDAWRAFGEFQRSEIRPTRLRTDYTDRLRELTMPTLFVQGSADQAVPLAAARRASELVPDARLAVMEGAAHWVQRDQPDAVADAVLGFLRELA